MVGKGAKITHVNKYFPVDSIAILFKSVTTGAGYSVVILII